MARLRSLMFGTIVAILGASLVGCAKDTVTEADAQKMREEFSREKYEEAMIKAGRQAELEEEKRLAAERGDQQVEGQQ